MYVAMFVSGGDGVQGADGAVGYDTAWPQCLQYAGMHALSNCDMTSYPYASVKIKTLLTDSFPGSCTGEMGATQTNTFFHRRYPCSLTASHSSSR